MENRGHLQYNVTGKGKKCKSCKNCKHAKTVYNCKKNTEKLKEEKFGEMQKVQKKKVQENENKHDTVE